MSFERLYKKSFSIRYCCFNRARLSTGKGSAQGAVAHQYECAEKAKKEKEEKVEEVDAENVEEKKKDDEEDEDYESIISEIFPGSFEQFLDAASACDGRYIVNFQEIDEIFKLFGSVGIMCSSLGYRINGKSYRTSDAENIPSIKNNCPMLQCDLTLEDHKNKWRKIKQGGLLKRCHDVLTLSKLQKNYHIDGVEQPTPNYELMQKRIGEIFEFMEKMEADGTEWTLETSLYVKQFEECLLKGDKDIGKVLRSIPEDHLRGHDYEVAGRLLSENIRDWLETNPEGYLDHGEISATILAWHCDAVMHAVGIKFNLYIHGDILELDSVVRKLEMKCAYLIEQTEYYTLLAKEKIDVLVNPPKKNEITTRMAIIQEINRIKSKPVITKQITVNSASSSVECHSFEENFTGGNWVKQSYGQEYKEQQKKTQRQQETKQKIEELIDEIEIYSVSIDLTGRIKNVYKKKNKTNYLSIAGLKTALKQLKEENEDKYNKFEIKKDGYRTFFKKKKLKKTKEKGSFKRKRLLEEEDEEQGENKKIKLDIRTNYEL